MQVAHLQHKQPFPWLIPGGQLTYAPIKKAELDLWLLNWYKYNCILIRGTCFGRWSGHICICLAGLPWHSFNGCILEYRDGSGTRGLQMLFRDV